MGSATARSSLESDAAAKLVNTGAFRTDVVMDRGAKAEVPPASRSSDRIEDGVFIMRMIAVLRVCVVFGSVVSPIECGNGWLLERI